MKPFADIALEEIQEKMGIKNAFTGEYPDWLLQAILERSLFLLEGGRLKAVTSELTESLFPDGEKTYSGMDQATSEIISTFVSAMAEQPLSEIVKALVEQVEDLSLYRASLIASTEISNAVEGSRYLLYQRESNGQIKMKWQTIMDGNQGDDHEANNGEIRTLGDTYPSGEVRPGQRPNCRCTTIAILD